MNQPLPIEHVQSEIFSHIRVILGVITSLAIARILNGLARFAQNRRRNRPYIVHTLWSFFMLLLIAHFWWFEFALASVAYWPFEAYVFLIFFASLHFFTAALLFPDELEVGDTYEEYFFEHRGWFFGFLAALFAFDLVDTWLKGWSHFASLGPFYPIHQIIYVILSLAAIRSSSRRFHFLLVILFLVAESAWILWRYGEAFLRL